jgi:hypothetical protein
MASAIHCVPGIAVKTTPRRALCLHVENGVSASHVVYREVGRMPPARGVGPCNSAR